MHSLGKCLYNGRGCDIVKEGRILVEIRERKSFELLPFSSEIIVEKADDLAICSCGSYSLEIRKYGL